MFSAAGPVRSNRRLLLAACLLSCTAGALAQDALEGFVTGAAAQAWKKWEAAMQAVLAKDSETAEAAFGELATLDPSPLRLGLFRKRSIDSPLGGAVLLFEQDAEAGALGDNGKQIADRLTEGVERMNMAEDGWWFASIGRFDVAKANFEALLATDPDPVALLEFADQRRRRHEVLVQLTDHPTLSEPVRKLIRLLAQGESAIKADPSRVMANLERLGGSPRANENALAALKESGEYAVPFMIQYLRDPEKSNLSQAILRAMPQLDRSAMNPLVMALRIEDLTVKAYVIQTLGQIPYRQSLPYLLALLDDSSTPPQIRSEVESALTNLRRLGVQFDTGVGAAQMFFNLAEAYYDNIGSLEADARLDQANVWYWRDNMLQNVPVPTQIFDEVMAMRCSEESLLLRPDMKSSLALWVAADIRREAQLGPDEQDATRPEGFPTAAYFAQSAGAEYCLMALDRALSDGHAAVALGCIDALRRTAGPSNILTGGAGSPPLAAAMTFPNRMVRIRAALALGRSRPEEGFSNYQNLMPVLAEALTLHGGARGALVVDPDAESLNAVAAILRAEGFTVLTDERLLGGLEQARRDLPGLDVIFIEAPGLKAGVESLRSDPLLSTQPLIVITKQGDRADVRAMVRGDAALSAIMADDEPGRVMDAVNAVSKAAGAEPITEEAGAALAMDAAETLRLLAMTNSSVFEAGRVQAALIDVAKSSKSIELRLTAADALGYIGAGEAQQTIAEIALNTAEESATRVAMFDSLAEAAKRRGNQLGSGTVEQLVEFVRSETDDALRTAASQALGALNLPSNKARELIVSHYGG
jgi:HEAT repeat protein